MSTRKKKEPTRKGKSAKRARPTVGRPPDSKNERYRWYANEESFSTKTWWKNERDCALVAPDIAPALLWERVRRHPDFLALRAAWLTLSKTAEFAPFASDDFWKRWGGDNVRDALSLLCRSWELDFQALLKVDSDDGLNPNHPLRPWHRGFAALGTLISKDGAFFPSKGSVCTDLLQWTGSHKPSTGGWAIQSVFGLPTSSFSSPVQVDGSFIPFERDRLAPDIHIGWQALKAEALEVGRVPLLLAIDPDASIEAVVEQFRSILPSYLKSPSRQRKKRNSGFDVIELLDGFARGVSNSEAASIIRRFEKSAQLDLAKLTDSLKVEAHRILEGIEKR